MKATNIYQTLKTKGYGTDGTKPQLPGVGSPLKKSPYKFNAGLKKAAAEGKLDNNPKFKDAVESSPAKLAPVVAAVGKKLLVGAAKKMIAKKAAEKLQQKQDSPAMMKGKPKKKGPKKIAIDKRSVADADAKKAIINKTPKNYDYPTGLKGEFYPKTESKKIKKYPSGVKGDKYKASPAKKYKSDAQRKAVHASKAEKSSPAKKTIDPPKGKKKSKSKDIDPGFYTNFPTVSGKDLTLQKRNIETKKANAERRRNETLKNATENAKKSMKNFSSSPAKKKVDGKKAKLISEKKDPKTGITTRKYDVGTNMPKIVKTKSSPAKKSCGYKK